MSDIFDKTDWGGVLVSTIASTIIAGIIAWYFRFKTRPKMEIVYESNRNDSFKFLFSNIRMFDDSFLGFYQYFENNVRKLGEDVDVIAPPVFRFYISHSISAVEDQFVQNNITLWENFENAKDSVNSTIKKLQEWFDKFSKDYLTYQDYIEDKFLRDVSKYYGFTLNYLYGIVDNYNHPTFLALRKEQAFKIIKYLEDDESIDKTFEPIAEFVEKWKDWESKQKIIPHSSMFEQNR